MTESKGLVGPTDEVAGNLAWNDHEGGRVMGESARVFTLAPTGTPWTPRNVGCSWDSFRNFSPQRI